MKDAWRKDYRHQNKRFIAWLEASQYTTVAAEGIREFTDVERSDPTKYCFAHKKDLNYGGFNASVFMAFLAETRVKNVSEVDPTKHILKSVGDVRKYGDAIQWGTEMAGERLLQTYYEQVDKWKRAYKKEHASAKADGRTEENDAEPISSILFTMMCTWAVQEGNIFVWVFGLMQWNLMARSINVDPSLFHNMKRGQSDSIEVLPDKTKSDQGGEFVTVKNIYGNPLNPFVSAFLALAVWLSLSSAWLEHTEKLFREAKSKEGSASSKYCRQLKMIIKRNFDEVLYCAVESGL